MRGKCSFSDCAFTEEDDVDVTKCSSCSKKVHHICSNAIYEGDLSVRVCSHNCVIALGLPTQSRTLWTSSAASTSDNQLTGGARAHGKTPRKSSKGKKKTSAPNSNKKESKQAKKFHFTTGDDLALLREILSVQPYAAKHGSVTARYQDVADNFNEHLGEELSLRTIKERFFLLLKDFKTTDNQYRRKSGWRRSTPSINNYFKTSMMLCVIFKMKKRKRRKQFKISRIGLNPQVKGFDTKL
ncbi:hypothetical protein GN244_ATG18691 [Phytophthora infestans]|uniref:Uncharacterized protein n=1 Tax=Phytophthora infestans TaxID=4787 RepID=A0A833S6H8_PHYIN|nr:hypothetical protein GN244_ATG18691 [Phytophthora infestans]